MSQPKRTSIYDLPKRATKTVAPKTDLQKTTVNNNKKLTLANALRSTPTTKLNSKASNLLNDKRNPTLITKKVVPDASGDLPDYKQLKKVINVNVPDERLPKKGILKTSQSTPALQKITVRPAVSRVDVKNIKPQPTLKKAESRPNVCPQKVPPKLKSSSTSTDILKKRPAETTTQLKAAPSKASMQKKELSKKSTASKATTTTKPVAPSPEVSYENVVRYPDIIDPPEMEAELRKNVLQLIDDYKLTVPQVNDILHKILGHGYHKDSVTCRKFLASLLQFLILRDPETNEMINFDDFMKLLLENSEENVEDDNKVNAENDEEAEEREEDCIEAEEQEEYEEED